MAQTSAPMIQRVLNSAWVRPVLFLVVMVAVWDVTIRVFKIPPYQIPAPEDVIKTLWAEWPLSLIHI